MPSVGSVRRVLSVGLAVLSSPLVCLCDSPPYPTSAQHLRSSERFLSTSPGDLDTSFASPDGYLREDFGAVEQIAYPSGIAVQPDGKIVAVGQGSTNLDFLVARYNTDGSLDLKVGTNVVVDDRGWAVAIQADGKILVGGRATPHPAIVRYNSDGTLDGSFGMGGKLVLTSITSAQGDKFQDLAIQPDGKIVGAVNGDFSNQFTVVRLNSADGSFDTTFDSNGIADINFPGASGTEFAHAVKIQSDGKIVVAGRVTATTPDIGIARLNTDGSLDASFNSNGMLQLDLLGGSDGANDIAFQSDGSIVICGQTASGLDPLLLRFDSSGVLDNTFVTPTPAPGLASIFSIEVTSNDKIVGAMTYESSNNMVIAQFNSDGTLDPTFGTFGVTSDMLSGVAFPFTVKLQADGKIVVGGQIDVNPNQDFLVARLLGEEVNTAPTTAGIEDVVAPEDSANTGIELFDAFDDDQDADSALAYSVESNTNPSLVSTSINQVTGVLTLDYTADANGVADITVSATDRGSLFVETTFQVTVLPADEQIEDVEDEVETLLDDEVLDQGQANPLLNFLNQAIDSLNKGKTSQAIKKLNDFIDRVQELMDDNELREEVGEDLIAAANAAIQSAS